MNNVAGIIFSNLHDRSIPELTARRTMGAIPFGGCYRMVDFPLSAMANAGIRNISVIAHHNYESLAEHIGSGADWGLPTDGGGIKLISPYMNAYANGSGELYTSRLESLKSICGNIERMKEKYVVMCDCDCIFTADITKILDFHASVNADLTVSTNTELQTDPGGRIREIDQSPSSAFDLNVNMWVFNRDYLVGAIKNASARGYGSITADVLCQNIKKDRYYAAPALDCDFLRVKSLADYYRISMRMLNDADMRQRIFENLKSRKQDRALTVVGAEAAVSSSLVSDGCVIEGKVENSVVFGGVRVEKGASVKNSILFPGVRISENARLDFVIADRNTDVRAGNYLAGCRILPYFIAADKIV